MLTLSLAFVFGLVGLPALPTRAADAGVKSGKAPAAARPAAAKKTVAQKPAGAGAAKGATPADKPAAEAKAAAAAEPAKPAAAPAGAATPPPGSSPMAELKKSNAQLDKILQKSRPDWSPEAELQRAEVRKLVGAFLDYGELARRALARHWEKLAPKQQAEFTDTLRELVERSYLKQVHGNPNYNIKYEKEAKSGNEATVNATLHTTARGKKVTVALEYKTLWQPAKERWVVYDVLTDDQSMLENYRAEFNKIINKEGFDALLKRMKKKLDEKQE